MCLVWSSAHIFMAFFSQLGDLRDWRSVLCTPTRQILYTNPITLKPPGFQRIKPHLLTLASNFQMPFYRDILMALRVCSVSKQLCSNILKAGPGSVITIVVGGAVESLSAHPGTADLTMRRRWVDSGCVGDDWYWWGDAWVGVHQACDSTWVIAISPLVLIEVGLLRSFMIAPIWCVFVWWKWCSFRAVFFVVMRLIRMDTRYTNKCRISGGPWYMRCSVNFSPFLDSFYRCFMGEGCWIVCLSASFPSVLLIVSR